MVIIQSLSITLVGNLKIYEAEIGYIKTILSEKEFEKVIAVYKKKYPEDYCFDRDFIKWMNKTYDQKAEIIEVVDVHF